MAVRPVRSVPQTFPVPVIFCLPFVYCVSAYSVPYACRRHSMFLWISDYPLTKPRSWCYTYHEKQLLLICVLCSYLTSYHIWVVFLFLFVSYLLYHNNVKKWTEPFWITILLYWLPMLFILPLWRDKTYKLYFNKQQDKSHIARDVKSFHAHLPKKRQSLFPTALSDYWEIISLSTISPIPLAHARMLCILPVHSKAFAPLAAVAPCVCFICSVRFSKRSRAGLTMSAR